ncbi:hypothetical protein AZ965_004436 [Salmonella enterica subsp. enterica serovar 4,[5],12:i:-]|uniref:ClpX-type ZB domain-containing protein n=24 Tax=Salmonella TaxID=590 RepID=A0A5Y2M401_SALET|nr:MULTISPECIES: ClpX C4-type zinc finger protein [Salmonella]YP_009324826.1 hypothetical protein BOW93_gp115 [Salmonella phage 118970_sal3]EAA4371273.1 hypothetical protein [Salmonella enterica subsp. enterica serovar Abony]EAA8374796.1 hypothetical protein [Salmonella enterica subsp. enterica serovar Bareilly]EAB9435124.1 hypothetical protein [Salmonella enterica subsp. enterica serovar Typhimurium str. UK-1]EAC0197124.1 hypothetical protein [Salmonella enterica subsp. enterica serovar Panam
MNNYYTCSFCGANEMDAKKIIAKGGNADPAICSECVVRCVGVLANTSTTESTRSTEMNNAASIEFWQLITALSEMAISSLKAAQEMGDEESACLIAKKLSVKFDYAPCRETV